MSFGIACMYTTSRTALYVAPLCCCACNSPLPRFNNPHIRSVWCASASALVMVSPAAREKSVVTASRHTPHATRHTCLSPHACVEQCALALCSRTALRTARSQHAHPCTVTAYGLNSQRRPEEESWPAHSMACEHTTRAVSEHTTVPRGGFDAKRGYTSDRPKSCQADRVHGGRAATQAAAVRIGRWWIGSPTLQPSCVHSTSHTTRGPSRHRSCELHAMPRCKPLHHGVCCCCLQRPTTCPVIDIHCS